MPMQLVGAVAGAAIGLAASPYLARLTATAADKESARWWTGARVDGGRFVVTAVAAAVLGGLGGRAAGWTALLPALVALALFCAPLAVIDYRTQRLPNRLVYPSAVAGAALLTLAALVEHDPHRLLRVVEGAAAVYVVLFVLRFISPRSFGGGDVKIGGILGAHLGWFGWQYVYYGIFAGFLFGAVIAVGLLASRRASMKTAVPFGPMLILGPFVVLAFHLVPSSL